MMQTKTGKRAFLLTIFWALTFTGLASEAEVKVPLENYLKGHATGDGTYFRKAFHPNAVMWGKRGDTLVQMPIEQYISRANGNPAPDESQRKRWIDMVEQSGDTAVARLILDYPTVKFTDYMTLLKIDGEWKIINKIFYAETKGK